MGEEFGLERSNISYHLNTVLDKECQIIELVKTVKHRGAREKIYTVRPEVIRQLLAVGDLPEPVRSALNGLSARGFLDVLSSVLAPGATDSLPGSALEWGPVAVPEERWPAIRDAAQHFVQTVSNATAANGKGNGSGVNLLIGIAAVPVAVAPSRKATARGRGPKR